MNRFLSKGFSLIEMLVVFAVMSILMTSSIASFYTYSHGESFRTSVSDVQHQLNVARARAMSQAKPSQCGTRTLVGYRISITLPNRYQLRVYCGNTNFILVDKFLPNGVTFGTGTSTSTQFAVSTGTLTTASNVIVTGYGNTTTIHIETTGIISIP